MGNILTQKRNGGGASATALDELTYNYHTTTDGLVSNRLYQVNDVVSARNYSDDIDDQGTFNNTNSTIETANNYGYDELGNLVRDVQEEIASIEWTVYGKMKKITRNSGSSKADLEFGYDASGNRLWKKVIPKGSGAVISTYYYLRDAQGNEMCRYVKYTNTTSQLMYVAQEHSIYGSSRVGVDGRKDTLYKAGSYSPAWGGANTSRRALGLKSFELANHLGNVLVTVSDKPVYKVSSGTIYFQPEITSSSDYYPFGAPIQGRSFSSAEYRFGFNNQEKDDEIKGSGNSYDFEFRIYDPRLGRFLSIDPLTKQYPMLTPYQFASNRPIDGIDIEGKEWISQHKWSDKITDAAHIKALGSDYVEGMTYQQAWTVMAPKLLEAKEGDTYDCANLSITVMVEYAYTFKLPVYVEDYKAEDKDPTFDNDNYGYKDKAGKKHTFAEGDWKGLADAIAGQYGAADLYNNNKLTTEKSFDNLQAGDLVGWDYPNGNVYHSQTVTEVGDSWLFDFDDKNDYYKTIQGSLSGGQGVPAYEKEYDIGDVKKDGNGSGAKTKALQWNTKNFDKHK
jgi:RHS repeat-associated protein